MMSSSTLQCTIEAIFAHYGLSVQLVSDNGPQFIAEEFSHFMQENGTSCVLLTILLQMEANRICTFKQSLPNETKALEL